MNLRKPFFHYVWRFNAIAIAVAALLAILLMIFAAIVIVKDITRDRNARNVVNISSDDPSDIDFQYNLNAGEYSDNGIVSFKLVMTQEFEFVYSSSKTTQNTVNYLLFDINTREQRWLLESNDQLILQRSTLKFDQEDKDEPAAAHLYTLITSDTNQDGNLSESDDKTIAIAQHDGTGFKILFDDVANTPSIENAGEGRIILTYRDLQGLLIVAEISLSDFSVTHKTVIEDTLPN